MQKQAYTYQIYIMVNYIKVREVDFGDQLPKSFVVSVASALRGGRIEVRADSIGGTLMAEIAVPHTGGWECWKDMKIL